MNPEDFDFEHIERELRKLQPTDVSYRPPKVVPNRHDRYRLWFALPVAAAASLFVVLYVFSPEPAKEDVQLPPEVAAIKTAEPLRNVITPEFSTAWQLYADITKDLPRVKTSLTEYKIIELTIAESKPVPVPLKRNRRLYDWSEDCLEL